MSLVKRPDGSGEWFLPGILAGLWFTFNKMIFIFSIKAEWKR